MDWLTEFPELGRRDMRDFRKGIDQGFKDFTRTYGEDIEAFFEPLLQFLIWLEKLLLATPWPLFITIVCLLAWFASRSIKIVVGSAISLFLIGFLGMWEDTMSTVSIIVVCTMLCIGLGLPIGILMSRSDRAQAIVTPILDVMQTIPSFVYLIPVVMLLGIGKVPGLISVVIYAIPPMIRLTDLGIRLVDKEVLEAADAFGASPWQKLVQVQIPLALPNIFAGVNQTIMMSLAMVVIASMIGVTGLGQPVLKAISNQYLAMGLLNGLAIVALAIIFDRISQSYGKRLQSYRGVRVSNSETKIEIKNLYKIFGDDPETMLQKVRDGVTKDELNDQYNHVLGLSDINLKMPAKGIQVVMGLSGSGKSTLIRHINRLIEPTAGEVWIDGENVLEMDEKTLREFRRNRASMVFQKFALLPHRSVMENTIYGLEIQGMGENEAEKQAAHWIERVGLAGYEENYPGQLSGGMQQRVGLARALATDADILLMDEAFSALDPLIRTDMQNILLDLQQELHKTIVFITHDLEEALRIGDQIAILRDGEVIQQGTPQQIVLKPKDDYIADFTKDINRGRVIQLKTIMKAPNDKPGPELSGEMLVEDAAQLVTESPSSQARVTNDAGDVIGVVGINDLIRAMARPDIESRLEEL